MPQGGGNAPSGGNNWKYFDVSAVQMSSEQLAQGFSIYSHVYKVRPVDKEENRAILPSAFFLSEATSGGLSTFKILAFAVDFSAPLLRMDSSASLETMEDLFMEETPIGPMIDQIFGLGAKEITKEEFLAL